MVRRGLLVALGMLSCSSPTPPATDGSSGDASDAPEDAFVLPPYVDPYACPASTAPTPLDEPLDASQTRAGVIRNPSELLGGEGASGRVGHLRIYNNRVRFVVQGRTGTTGDARPAVYNLYGGNLLDADRVRPRGTPGQDLFRETFPMIGYRAASAAEVAVACDGSNGRPAAIRVVGEDVPTRILGTFDGLARERGLRVVTHYILRPDSDVLEIRTEVQSRFGQRLTALSPGDFLGFGAALTLFTEETGFGNASRAGNPVTYLAAVSDPGENDRHVSYALGPAMGNVVVPLVDASGTAGLYDNLTVPERGSVEYVRYLSVGTGDVSSAVGPLLAQRNNPVGTVAGTTTPGAMVYAFRGAYTPGAVVRSNARAAMDGSFTLALTPGTYALVAVDQGRVRGAPVSVTVTAGQRVMASPTAGATGTLVLDVAMLGADSARVRGPIKVSLQGLGVEAPDGAFGELEGERESQGLHRVVFSRLGTERITVKPGRYRATLSRGESWDTAQVEVTVPADGEATLRGDLRRAYETPGWITGDFHQHTAGSIDSPRALCGRVLENAAEGLQYAATTDHDNVSDFGPCIRELRLEPWFNAMRGNEISVIGLGHFNAYPLEPSGGDAFAQIGAQYWADLTAQQLFDRVRAEPSDPVLHISHPRSNGFKGYFTTLQLDPYTLTGREPIARGYEAIEVNESLGDAAEFLASADERVRMAAQRDGSTVAVLHDWFALLNRGEHPCALGNSDTHGRNDSSGWPRNLLRVGVDDPSMATPSLVRDAIRSQRVVVSRGIVLRTLVGDRERMGWQDVVTAPGGAVDLTVEVRAAPWITTREMTIYENGRPLALTPDGRGGYDAQPAAEDRNVRVMLPGTSALRLRTTVHLHPTRASYYVVVARGGSLAPVAGGDAFGYTNPVYVRPG